MHRRITLLIALLAALALVLCRAPGPAQLRQRLPQRHVRALRDPGLVPARTMPRHGQRLLRRGAALRTFVLRLSHTRLACAQVANFNPARSPCRVWLRLRGREHSMACGQGLELRGIAVGRGACKLLCSRSWRSAPCRPPLRPPTSPSTPPPPRRSGRCSSPRAKPPPPRIAPSKRQRPPSRRRRSRPSSKSRTPPPPPLPPPGRRSMRPRAPPSRPCRPAPRRPPRRRPLRRRPPPVIAIAPSAGRRPRRRLRSPGARRQAPPIPPVLPIPGR